MKNTIRIVLIALMMILANQGKASPAPPSAEELVEHLTPKGRLGHQYRDPNGQEFTLINLNEKILELVKYKRGIAEDLKPPFYITREKPQLYQGYPTEMKRGTIEYYRNRNINTFCFYTVEGKNTPKGWGDRYIFGLIPNAEGDQDSLHDLRNLRF